MPEIERRLLEKKKREEVFRTTKRFLEELESTGRETL